MIENIILQNKIEPKKFTIKIIYTKGPKLVFVIKDIRPHSIKNFAVSGNPENNKIKNQKCFVNFGNKRCNPFI